jgi:hypothetical protein
MGLDAYGNYVEGKMIKTETTAFKVGAKRRSRTQWSKRAQAEHRKKWLAALESGEYRRGVNALRIEGKASNSYCCLGLACEISNLGSWDGSDYKIDGRIDSSDILGPVMRNWLGLKESSGRFTTHDLYEDSLVDRNDGGMSFKKIAKVIRKNPEGLLV